MNEKEDEKQWMVNEDEVFAQQRKSMVASDKITGDFVQLLYKCFGCALAEKKKKTYQLEMFWKGERG